MTRNTMPIIYGVLAILAIGLGLFVANLFGNPVSNTSAPSSNSVASTQVRTSTPTTAATAAATQTPKATSKPTQTPKATTAATTRPTTTAPTNAVTAAPAATTAATAATSTTAQPTATAYIEYTIQRGDTLKAIAQRYNVTLQQILAINDIPNPDSLTVGKVIKIPTQ